MLEIGLYTALAGHNLGLMRPRGAEGSKVQHWQHQGAAAIFRSPAEDVIQVQSGSPCL